MRNLILYKSVAPHSRGLRRFLGTSGPYGWSSRLAAHRLAL